MEVLRVLVVLLWLCAVAGCGNKGELRKEPKAEEAVACVCD